MTVKRVVLIVLSVGLALGIALNIGFFYGKKTALSASVTPSMIRKTATDRDSKSLRNPVYWEEISGSALPDLQNIETHGIEQMTTEELAQSLTRYFNSTPIPTPAALNDVIKIADEMIDRNPDAYGAYKAKLISLVMREAKYNVPIDENEYQSLIEDMLRFRDYDESFSLQEQNPDQNTALVETDETLDPDLIRIPFLRIMLRGDYAALMNEAEDYMDQNPTSPFGYYFMAQGQWRTGQRDEALNTLQAAIQKDARNEILLNLFQSHADASPLQYLEGMKVFVQ